MHRRWLGGRLLAVTAAFGSGCSPLHVMNPSSPSPTWGDFVAAWPLFKEAILAGTIAGAVLGFLGVFILVRRMVFVTATLTQAAGLGVALAFYVDIHLGLGLPPIAGALLAALAASVLASLPYERLHLSRESALAALWLFASGGAVVVGSRIAQEAHDIAAILFGSAVLVSPEDLTMVAAVGGVGLVLGFLGHEVLVFSGFDPDAARVQGVPVRLMESALLVLVTFEVAVATRAIGALPVFAFSVMPAMAALLVAPGMRWTFPIAALGGALVGLGGYMAAFFFDLPVGATQTALACLLVVAAMPVRVFLR
ncbi:MAG: metal ABC transporter permease [Myxococcota bacterium]